MLERYWDVGGVRIEGSFPVPCQLGGGSTVADGDDDGADNVLITPDGYENLTTAIKEVEDMERIINGGGSE